MRGWLFALAALGALSCDRCAKPAATVDAGCPSCALSLRQAHPTDVRTALMTLFPEFRGAVLTGGSAELVRELEWMVPEGQALEQVLAPLVRAKGFAPPDGGVPGVVGVRGPFTLHATAEGGHLRLAARLPVDNDDVAQIYQSPAPLSTEVMGTFLPVPDGAKPISERFTLSIDYQAREVRADFLVRQMVDLLRTGEWKAGPLPEGWEPDRRPDGGVGGVPAKFELSVTRAAPATLVRVVRDGAKVHLELLHPTWP